MDDYTYQEDVTGVVGGFEGLKGSLYAELRGFEGAFQVHEPVFLPLCCFDWCSPVWAC